LFFDRQRDKAVASDMIDYVLLGQTGFVTTAVDGAHLIARGYRVLHDGQRENTIIAVRYLSSQNI
jgi:hypothetical protein